MRLVDGIAGSASAPVLAAPSAGGAGAVAALLVAMAVGCAAASVRRAPRSLAAARRQMFGALPGGVDDPPVVRRRLDLPGGVTAAVERLVGGGLRVAELTAADVATRVLVATAAVGVSVLASVVGLVSFGLLPASPLWVLGPPLAAAIAGWTMVLDTRSRIARRRRALHQAANDFVQLVAVGLTTDQSVEEAVRFALDVGDGPAFGLVRHAVATAPQRGVPVWEALDAVGSSYEIGELCEFAASVERQGLQGVSIGSTVATLAESMRAKALDRLERDADRANANLAGPTVGFVVSTVIFLAYPLAVRISEAFGG